MLAISVDVENEFFEIAAEVRAFDIVLARSSEAEGAFTVFRPEAATFVKSLASHSSP